ncbi:octopamine receptor beta-2R-like [Diadema antillarum]|uniref:octopamine receptor beta-2R-like n=1 Tax=Diadema antillarum TaxID=105358 RepID=UPI003A87AA74
MVTEVVLVNFTADDNQDPNESGTSLIFILQGLIMFVFAVLIIATNVLNIVVIPRLPDINDASKVFYNFLSFADLILGFVLLPALPSTIVGEWPFGEVFCKICGFCMTLVGGISSASLLLLNLDRYFSISSPYRYVAFMSRQKAFMIAFSLCFAEALLLLAFLFVNPYGVDIIEYSPLGACIMSFSKPMFIPYSFVIFSLCIWLFVPILSVMYSRIVCISRRHVRRIQVQELTTVDRSKSVKRTTKDDSEDQPNTGIDSKQNKKSTGHRALKMTIMVTGTYVMAWMPFTICQLYVAMVWPKEVSMIIRAVVCWPLLLNPLCNIVIYSVTKRSYRICARNILRSCLRCSLADMRNASPHEVLS